MRYVTTNIRLPEDLWKSLKMDAAKRGWRLSQVIRERLSKQPARTGAVGKRGRSLCGIWKDFDIPDSLIEEAKRSLFPDPEKFLK